MRGTRERATQTHGTAPGKGRRAPDQPAEQWGRVPEGRLPRTRLQEWDAFRCARCGDGRGPPQGDEAVTRSCFRGSAAVTGLGRLRAGGGGGGAATVDKELRPRLVAVAEGPCLLPAAVGWGRSRRPHRGAGAESRAGVCPTKSCRSPLRENCSTETNGLFWVGKLHWLGKQ